MFVFIPVQIDAGYPAFVKGSHKVSQPRPSADQLPEEIPLEIGSVLLWNGGVELVYPAVGGFEHGGGGFAIMLGY